MTGWATKPRWRWNSTTWVCLEQGREMFPEDAEHWYTLALEKYEKLGDWRSAGDECRQLGVLFHEQKNLGGSGKMVPPRPRDI